ncbi:MAG: alpha/beta hydrolase [Candidatus Hydrogenedentota bacterium]|nr:MAG: alpha/beta hydrolase [Candidatus Hydrogenedentota bacterium]
MPSEQLEMLVQMLRARKIEGVPSIEEARAYLEKAAAMFTVADDVRCEPVQVCSVPAEWVVAPGALEERVIFYLHGGGYALGSLNTHRELVSRLSRAAKARALSIDYRLAPEHPHPAAFEDSMAAYRWLLSNGTDPSRTVIAGDSAGGGLAVATLVALRDAGEPLPAAGVCLSPWVDLEGTGQSATTKAEVDPIVTPEGEKIMARLYAGEANLRAPFISPLYADLHGLPPLLIQVGTAEVLLDDSTRLAERARAAGVNVVLEPWEEMIHVWQFFAAMLPEGQQAIDRIGDFIRRHTG